MLGPSGRTAAIEARRIRVRTKLALEPLEDRAVPAYGPISSAWFETLASSPPSANEAVQAENIERQWILRLTEKATAGIGNVSQAGTLLDGGPNLEILGGLGLPGMLLVGSNADPAVVDAFLAKNPNVAYAHRNGLLELAATIPDDPRFGDQYGLLNTGQLTGTVDADIDATDAWDLTTGSSDVVIAFVDTGVQIGAPGSFVPHPDLGANIWVNPGEIPNNGMDDDMNGFVDDVHGYDFHNGDGNPDDDNGHGTNISGIAAAIGNNTEGIAGVSWNAKILPIKFAGASNSGTIANAILSTNYATMMRSVYGVNIRVMNHSWQSNNTFFNQGLFDAFDAAGDAGILLVAAAGNRAEDLDMISRYPATFDIDELITVAATDRFDALWEDSSFGATEVDLGAPGFMIRTTGLTTFQSYQLRDGTSMAAPFVSGTAALLWSLFPDATVAQVKSAILAGVDPIASLSGITVTGGRLNARGALDQLTDALGGATVTEAFIAGTSWDPSFETYLETESLGESAFGYSLPFEEVDQFNLPWVNVDTVSIRFDSDVNPAFEDLEVFGSIVPQYALDSTAFTYDASTFTATWQLQTGFFANDTVRFVVDIADFDETFDFLPGDIDDSGNVSISDLIGVATRLNETTLSVDYDAVFDLDGSGSITISDLIGSATRLNDTLPAPLPVAPVIAESIVGTEPKVASQSSSDSGYETAEAPGSTTVSGGRRLRYAGAVDQVMEQSLDFDG